MSIPVRVGARRPPGNVTVVARSPLRSAGRRTLVLGLLLGVALLAAGASAATAQPSTEPVTSVRLTLTDLTGVLGPGSVPTPSEEAPVMPEVPRDLGLRLLVENDGTVPLDSLRVVVEIHPPSATRGLLRQALDGDLRSQPLHVHVTDELVDGRLEPGEVAGVTDVFPREEVEWADDPGGVHPLRIAVTRGTDVLDEIVTAAVWLGRAPVSPLLTTLIWPLDSPPWRTVGGAYPDGAAREIRPGGRLDTLLVAAEATRDVPLTLAPTAHLLEDLSDRADGFDALARQDDGSVESHRVSAEAEDASDSRQTLRRIRRLADELEHPPVTGAYADADLSALSLASEDLQRFGGEAAIEGRRRVQLQLGTAVDASVHLVEGPIGAAALDLLPGDTVLLSSSAVEGLALAGDPRLDEPVRPLRTPAGRLLTALVADPYLEEALADAPHRAGPLVSAQRVVAETAMAYLVAPGTADRGLVLRPPATWDPSPRAAIAVLEGLRDAAWIDLASPSRVASEARASTAGPELVVPVVGGFGDDLTDDLLRAETTLGALASALPEPDRRIQGRSLQELHDDLLRATSRWYRSPGSRGNGEARTLVRDVQRAADLALGEVEVSTGTVTLTSDTGEIPVTLQRTRGGPVLVAVSVESQGRLLWPDGRRSEAMLLAEDGSQTVSFETRALSTGTFPVTVRVTDPGGGTVIAETTLSVRSTAIAGAALTGTGVLVVVLLLFGAVRRRDRPDRHRRVTAA